MCNNSIKPISVVDMDTHKHPRVEWTIAHIRICTYIAHCFLRIYMYMSEFGGCNL